jgi:hypothetical protein
MRTQSEGAVEERQNGEFRQGWSCRDEEEEGFVSERVRARAVEYGRCGIIF